MSDKEYKTPITVKEEEIDLGKMFSMIGKLFSKFLNNIGLLFKGTFHYLILLLIFIKKHLAILFSAIFLGSIIGFLIDYTSKEEFTYDMIIQPNYHSIDQIYENLEYYNVLIQENDTVALSEEFNVSYKVADNLRSFELIAYETERDIIYAYDEFIKNTDTLTQKHFPYSTFRGRGASKFDSYRYVYRIKSYDSNLKSFRKKIVSDIEANSSLQNRKKIKLSTLKLDSIGTVKALKDANELRSLYKEVTLLEVENNKSSTSTYIDFSKESKQNNDIELFNIVKELNKNLITIENQKEKSEHIVNIITDFNSAGKRMKTIYQTKMFRLGSIFGGLILFFILIKLLNNYLKKYQLKNS